MRSKEFLKEAPPNPEDSGGPARGTVAAAQADAARIAQGDKNLNAIKGFFGMKPTELKDAPPGTTIDPIQRSRMGYKPATQKEIADFQAANPNYGKVVGRDGQPIKTGDGSDLVSGGGAAVVQTAQAAAPQTKGAAHAGQGGYNYQPPTPISTTADAKSDILPPAGAAPAAPAAAPAAPAAAPDDSAARAYAAADADRAAIKDLTRLADVPAPAPAAEPVVTAAELGSQTFPSTAAPAVPAAAEVPATTAALPPRPGQTTSGQAATPAKTAPRVSPAVVGYASSMGLYKNGQPDPAAIKAFQRKNNLTADGIIGGNTSAAILSAAKPGMAGSSRGQQGGAPAPATSFSSPIAPRRDSNTQRQTLAKTMPGPGARAAALPAPQTGAAGQAARAAARAAGQVATPVSTRQSQSAVMESQEITRMRFLAGLSKD
jgi:peptidoglycan hydrolase-like protein with peptidoglycan-binding domain